jgi:hypothetical protein
VQVAIGLTAAAAGLFSASFTGGTAFSFVSIALFAVGIGTLWDATGDMDER